MDRFDLEGIKDVSSKIRRADNGVPGHSERVAEYAVAVAEEMGLEPGEIEVVRHAAVLHDIGKIALSEEIVNKLGELTQEEFEVMKLHATIALGLLERADGLRAAAPLIKHHHERIDGSGYPDGLKGDEIPLGARIIGVCEAYDIMTSEVTWRPRLAHDEAVDELARCAGTQFDAGVVKAFVRVMAARFGEAQEDLAA